jgi:hypothetical protein
MIDLTIVMMNVRPRDSYLSIRIADAHTHTHTHASTGLPNQTLIYTYIVDAVFNEPVECFQKEQNRKHCHKLRTEVITKHGERQTCFGQCEPTALH